MPIVKTVETSAASKKKVAEKLMDSLSLCSDEADLKQWELESDLTVFNGDTFWTEYLDQEIEKQKQHINQNKETRQCL